VMNEEIKYSSGGISNLISDGFWHISYVSDKKCFLLRDIFLLFFFFFA
jgi:hypothetical protein